MLFTPKAPSDSGGRETLPFLVETTPPLAVRRRDRGFRRGLLVADCAAGVLVASLITAWSGEMQLGWELILIPALVALVNAISGMYERDEKLINKNTLDETPALMHAAAVVAVLTLAIEALVLDARVEP